MNIYSCEKTRVVHMREQTQKNILYSDTADEECCDYLHIHKQIVDNVMQKMPSEEKLLYLSDLFRVFGDSTRIKILYVLFESEMCVCDIAKLISMTQSAISHQLKVLRQMRLIKSRRQGKTVFYSLADEHVRSIIFGGMEHISE